MRKTNRPTQRGRLRPEWENTCNYCLYYHAKPRGRSKTSGNCSHHQQWIEMSEFTTCSDMSPQPLEPGIYLLEPTSMGDWTYTRREGKIRTKLFAMEGGTSAAKSGRARKKSGT
jgi:hypothetical protein